MYQVSLSPYFTITCALRRFPEEVGNEGVGGGDRLDPVGDDQSVVAARGYSICQVGAGCGRFNERIVAACGLPVREVGLGHDKEFDRETWVRCPDADDKLSVDLGD